MRCRGSAARGPAARRLVLTGWFGARRAPSRLSEDGAPSEEAAEILDAALAVAYDAMDELELARVRGLPRRARVAVTAAGVVESVDAPAYTRRVDSAEQRPLDDDEVSDDVSTRRPIAAPGEAAFPPHLPLRRSRCRSRSMCYTFRGVILTVYAYSRRAKQSAKSDGPRA